MFYISKFQTIMLQRVSKICGKNSISFSKNLNLPNCFQNPPPPLNIKIIIREKDELDLV